MSYKLELAVSSTEKVRKRQSRRTFSRSPKNLAALAELQEFAQCESWQGMITIKPRLTESVDTSNEMQKYLEDLMRREFRERRIGFLLVREICSKNNARNESHFHILTAKSIHPDLKNRLKSFVRRRILKLGGNDGGLIPLDFFHYRENTHEICTFGKYVAKEFKYVKNGSCWSKKFNAKFPTKPWDDNLLIKMYSYGFLTTIPDLSGVAAPFSPQEPKYRHVGIIKKKEISKEMSAKTLRDYSTILANGRLKVFFSFQSDCRFSEVKGVNLKFRLT